MSVRSFPGWDALWPSNTAKACWETRRGAFSVGPSTGYETWGAKSVANLL
jgi:hypothetical protein